MKIFKTNAAKRESYTYTFTNVDGKEQSVTLRPGEDGVTEADIKMLHSLDDSEVCNAWSHRYILCLGSTSHKMLTVKAFCAMWQKWNKTIKMQLIMFYLVKQRLQP